MEDGGPPLLHKVQVVPPKLVPDFARLWDWRFGGASALLPGFDQRRRMVSAR